MGRVNTASVRIGGLAAVVVLFFWSIWSLFAAVPVLSEVQITPKYSSVLPRTDPVVLPQVMVLDCISIWSRWLDPIITWFFVALLTQVIMRADDKLEARISVITGLFVGLLLVPVGSTELGILVTMLTIGLIFGVVASLGSFGAGMGAGGGAVLLGAGLILGPIFGLCAGLTLGLAYLCSQSFRRKLWPAVRRWLTAQE